MPPELVSIILPVYNQADFISTYVKECEDALYDLPYKHELLLVVNGSSDESLQICQALAQAYRSVRVLHSEAGGWGLAVKLGLSEARGDLLCYTNSARTAPHDLLLMVLYGAVNPGVVVKANRKFRDNWTRRLGSLLYNLECRALFDLPCWDINGTPKVFPRKLAPLLKLECNDDLIDLEFNAVCRQFNYPMLEVPILTFKRRGGRSTTSLKSAYKMYWGAFKLWRKRRHAT